MTNMKVCRAPIQQEILVYSFNSGQPCRDSSVMSSHGEYGTGLDLYSVCIVFSIVATAVVRICEKDVQI